MKKIIFLLLSFLIIAFTIDAQKLTKTVLKSKVVKAKTSKAKTGVNKSNKLWIDLYGKNADGGNFSEPLYRGDKLVYHVNTGTKEYDFIVTINKYDFNKGIDFNYEMTNSSNTKGHVIISGAAKNTSKKYVNYFRGGDLKLTDAATVWLCYDNFMDLPAKKTQMTFDNGEEETFYRQDNDEVNPVIIFKGKEMKLDAFIINNGADGKGNKTLWVLNGSGNPLILKMDLGWTIELKEVR